MSEPAGLIQIIREEPGVIGATGSVLGPVLAESASRISTPRIKGWDAETAPSVIPLPECIVEGSWSPGPEQLVVGSEWARANQAGIGSEVNLLAPQQFKDALAGKSMGAVPKKYLSPEHSESRESLPRGCLNMIRSTSLRTW